MPEEIINEQVIENQDGQPAPNGSEEQSPWAETFETPEEMWNGYRHLQSAMDRKVNELSSALQEKEGKIEELTNGFSDLQEKVSPFTDLIQKIGESKNASEIEQRRAELAEKILTEPDEGIKEVLKEYIPDFVNQYVKPLEEKIQAIEGRSQTEDIEAYREHLIGTYGEEMIAQVLDNLRKEAADYGENAQAYLAQFDNPVALEARISAEANAMYAKALQDAIQNNDRQALSTLLAKQNEANIDSAQSFGGGAVGNTLVDRIEADMDKAYEDGNL